MDVRCVICAEPWEMDSLHEEVQERFAGDARMIAYNESGPCKDQKLYEPMYREVQRDFQSRGCIALSTAFGTRQCERSNDIMAGAAEVLYDLLGDDMDGAAAMLEDFEMGY